MHATRWLSIGLASILVLAAETPVAAADSSTVGGPSIVVSGNGTVHVAPDVAFVTVGVQEQDPHAATAQEEANAITAEAITRIEALGIPARDIQTLGISLDPQYDASGTLTGFTASDSLSITVEQPKQAGAVIDAGVRAGANTNVSVSFGLKDDTAARTAALRAAVAVAQRKATAVAAQLGVSLRGAKIQVRENQAAPPVPPVQTGPQVGPGVASTPVQPGTLTISDSVSVTYVL